MLVEGWVAVCKEDVAWAGPDTQLTTGRTTGSHAQKADLHDACMTVLVLLCVSRAGWRCAKKMLLGQAQTHN